MALQFDEKPPGALSTSARTYARLEDDKDWNPKMDDVEVTSREINEGTVVSRHEKRLDPVTDLKQRLSLWGMANHEAKSVNNVDDL